MDRASDSGSEGWGFESLPAYQKIQTPFGVWIFCCRWDSNHLNPTVRWTVGGAGWTAPNLTICQRQIAPSPFRPPPSQESPNRRFPRRAVPNIVTAVQNRDVDNHQQVPPPQQTVSLPPAGSLRHLRCQLPPGGSYGVRTFSHWFVLLGKCLLWNPSVTATPCQLPLAREPLGAVSIPGGSGKQRAAEIYRAH